MWRRRYREKIWYLSFELKDQSWQRVPLSVHEWDLWLGAQSRESDGLMYLYVSTPNTKTTFLCIIFLVTHKSRCKKMDGN